MKCKIVLGLMLALGSAASAQITYENNGLVLSPPDIPPQIDATTFINAGRFIINYTNDLLLQPFPPAPVGPYPFETSNTQNYTNLYGDLMSCNVGFRMEYFDTASGQRRRAANFHNAGVIENGTINTTNFLLPGGVFNFVAGLPTLVFSVAGSKFTVSATNIVNPGTINMGFEGFLKLQGESIDLKNGFLNMETEGFSLNGGNGNLFFNGGIFDGYWGVSTNIIGPAGFFEVPPPLSPPHLVTDRNSLVTIQQILINNGFTYLRDEFDATGTNRFVRAVFLQNTNAELQANVYFPDLNFNAFFLGDIGVEFTNVLGTAANNLYVLDAYLVFTNQQLVLNGFAGSRPTFIPFNYAVFQSQPLGFGTPPEVPTVIPFGTFNNTLTTNQYSAYKALFLPTSVVLSDVFGQDVTNVPGRIEVVADKFLDVSHARITSLNYLKLSATNHFSGGSDSKIGAPFVDMNLRSTNGFLSVSNLLAPTIARPEGDIRLYSARWTNTVTGINPVTGAVGTITNYYHVLFVDAGLSSFAPSRGEDVILRSVDLAGGGPDNLFISDILTVTRQMILDSQRITITTNEPGAATPTGGINVTDPRIVWANSTPRLQYLTNSGFINSANSMFFGGSRTSPYYTSNFNEPYLVFVNHGSVTNFSSQIWANYFENSGTFAAGGAGINLQQSQNAVLTNGLFSSLAEVGISSSSLFISNHLIQAFGPVSINASSFLSDGSALNGTADLITNKNNWLVSGFSLLGNPAIGSLLGTTISNVIAPFQRVVNRFALPDRGCSAAGFVNNSAIGRMILDGGTNSVFEFAGTGSANAVYIDQLELRNFTATNRDPAGNFLGLQIDPNIMVYFGDALANGVSVAEKLNGKNGGRLCWVSDYNCGFFSSTNILYPNGTTNRVNRALSESCTLDSNGNGIVNCMDPAPIPNSCVLPPPLAITPTNEPPGTGDGGSSEAGAALPTLDLPVWVRDDKSGTNAMAAVTGTFNGLIYDTNGVGAASSGYFTAKTTSQGSYSAKLMLAGKTYSLSGRFDAQGRTTKALARTGASALKLELRLNSAGDQLRGRVSTADWSAELLADRLAWSKSQPAGQAGSYTLVIPGRDDDNSPAGSGFGTVKVDSSGSVKWVGTLADGTKVSQGSALSKQGIWPVYASLNGGSGMAMSWIQFAPQGGNDLQGQFVWLKPAMPANFYPQGFTNSVGAVGSVYQAPAPGRRALNLSSGSLVLSGGGLAVPITTEITLGLNNKASGAGVSLSITPSTGLFKGSAINSQTGKALPFQGVLFKKGNIGVGYFLGTDQSGEVYLGPNQ